MGNTCCTNRNEDQLSEKVKLRLKNIDESRSNRSIKHKVAKTKDQSDTDYIMSPSSKLNKMKSNATSQESLF